MGTMVNPAHPGECLRDSVRAMGWTGTASRAVARAAAIGTRACFCQ